MDKPSKKRKFIKFILIGLVVILFWRGVDGLLDAYLFPGNDILSSIASLILGTIIFFAGNFSLKDID